MRKPPYLAVAAMSVFAVPLTAEPADARQVCQRVCDGVSCERRCVWVEDGDRTRDRRWDRRPAFAPPANPAACVPSGFAGLSRNCTVDTGGCQLMPESCSYGWCCP